MSLIPSLLVSIPHLASVNENAQGGDESSRTTRAIKPPKPPRAPSPGFSSNLKPKPKPGQKVDGSGWPVNKAGQRVNADGKAIDKSGHRINELNQRINDKGQAIDGRNRLINPKNELINEHGQRVNTQNQPVDEQNRRIDSQNRLINSQGRLINEKRELVDKDNNRVNQEGYRVDDIGRPLDKDGKVAKSKASAVLGNNEPHEQIVGVKKTLARAPAWEAATATPPAKPNLSPEHAAKQTGEINKLVAQGEIPVETSKAKVARDAAITAGVTGVVSLPTNLASTASTTMTAEAIKAKYLPVPLATATPAAATPTTAVAGTAVQMTEAEKANELENEKQQATYSRMDDLQVSTYSAANDAMSLAFGDNSNGWLPPQTWSSDPLERMEQLESLMNHVEANTAVLGPKYRVYFSPHLPENDPAPGVAGLQTRVENLEARLSQVQATATEVINKKLASSGT